MLFGIHPRVHNRCRTLHHACNPLATCVSVRRRDRCTRTFSFHFLVLLFWFVCISPNLYNVPELPYTSTKVKRTTHQSTVGAALWCRPLSLWWFCGPLDMLPLLGSLLCCAPVGASRCLPGSVVLLVVLGWALPFCRLASVSVLFVSLPPRFVLFGALVQPYLVFAGTSL